jgi:hypothetical protein
MPITPPKQGYAGKAVISDSPAGLVLELPTHVPFYHSIYSIILMLFVLAVGGGPIVLAWKSFQAGNAGAGAVQVVVALVFGLIGLLITRRSIWKLFGMEVVALSTEGLTIRNKHLWFSGPRHFSIGSIKGLCVGPPPEVDWGGRKYHPRYGPYARYGRMVFYADGRRVEFGEDIEADEAAYLVRLLQARLDAYAGAAGS